MGSDAPRSREREAEARDRRAGPGPAGPGPEVPIPSTIRGPLAGLSDLATALREPSSALSTFLRGLAVGALVGAAIAGSRLWRRRRRR